MTQGSSIKVQVFQDRKEAAQWLGVPMELLAAKPPAANHSGWINGMNNMKLPPDVEFYEDIRLIVWRPHGLVNKAVVNRIISVLGELETALKEPFNRFSDTVAADAVNLNFEYIISVSLYRRRFYGKRPPIKSAILATDSTLIHYGKVHALLTQGSPINVRVFQDRKEAAKWLGVPIAILVADANQHHWINYQWK
jgi:hypothetical protein